MNSETKKIILTFICAAAIFYIYTRYFSLPNINESQKTEDKFESYDNVNNKKNSGPLKMDDKSNNISNSVITNDISDISNIDDSDINDLSNEDNIKEEDNIKDVVFDENDLSTIKEKKMASKFKSRNQAGRKQKIINYSQGEREFGKSDWENQFSLSNKLFSSNKFEPSDDLGKYSPFTSKGPIDKESPEEIFNIDNLLPKEVNADAFEIIPEPVSSKNRHLITVTRPVGTNTVGTTRKIANYDLRASPPCPKTVVSPWMQSSVEPDTNIKPLF